MLNASTPVTRHQAKFVNHLYSDTRKIYFPPVARDIVKKMQDEELERLKNEEKLKFKQRVLQKKMSKINGNGNANLNLKKLNTSKFNQELSRKAETIVSSRMS